MGNDLLEDMAHIARLGDGAELFSNKPGDLLRKSDGPEAEAEKCNDIVE